MQKINTEEIISTLLMKGFKSVDSILYTYTLGKISSDNAKLKLFEIEDKPLSLTFKERVDFNGISFELKKDKIKPRLHTNEVLSEYFDTIDFWEELKDHREEAIKAEGVWDKGAFDYFYKDYDRKHYIYQTNACALSSILGKPNPEYYNSYE